MPTVRLFAVLLSLAALSASVPSITVAAEQKAGEDPQAEATAYRESLSALDPSDLGSVQEALRQFRDRFDNQPVKERDAAFLAFRVFYYGVEDKQSRLLWGRESEEIENDDALKASLGESGFRLVTTEGDWYVRERPDFLYEEFSERVSEALRVFLQLRMRELREGLGGDATLNISFEDLGDRVLAWERYLAQYPDSPLRDEANFFYPSYWYLLLTGTDNTPVHDQERENGEIVRRLRPHIRKVYREYAEKNAGTKTGMILKEYYSLLEKNDFQWSDEIRAFLKDSDKPLWVSPQPASW